MTVLTTAPEAGLPRREIIAGVRVRRTGALARIDKGVVAPGLLLGAIRLGLSRRRRGVGTATGRGWAPGAVRRSETAAPVVRLRPPARAGPSVAHSVERLSAWLGARRRAARAAPPRVVVGLRPGLADRLARYADRAVEAIPPVPPLAVRTRPVRRPEGPAGCSDRAGGKSDSRRADRFREGLAGAEFQAYAPVARAASGRDPDRGRRKARPLPAVERLPALRARWRTIRVVLSRLPAGRRISPRLYLMCDALAWPSIDPLEAFGMVQVEALAAVPSLQAMSAGRRRLPAARGPDGGPCPARRPRPACGCRAESIDTPERFRIPHAGGGAGF